MTEKGHEARFPTPRPSAASAREETIAGMRRNGRDAPIPVVRITAAEPSSSTQSRYSPRGRHRPPIRSIWVGRLPFRLPLRLHRADVFFLRFNKANASVMNGCYFSAYRLVYRCAVENRNS